MISTHAGFPTTQYRYGALAKRLILSALDSSMLTPVIHRMMALQDAGSWRASLRGGQFGGPLVAHPVIMMGQLRRQECI
jgi:hypothetical protein